MYYRYYRIIVLLTFLHIDKSHFNHENFDISISLTSFFDGNSSVGIDRLDLAVLYIHVVHMVPSSPAMTTSKSSHFKSKSLKHIKDKVHVCNLVQTVKDNRQCKKRDSAHTQYNTLQDKHIKQCSTDKSV